MSYVSLGDLRKDVRSAIYEPEARTFSDEEINRWLNLGLHDYCAYVQPMKKIWTYPILNILKATFNLPNDTFGIERVNWAEQWPLQRCQEMEFRQKIWTAPSSVSVYPMMYMENPMGNPGPVDQNASEDGVTPGSGSGWAIEVWQPPAMVSASLLTTGTIPATSALATISVSTSIPTGGNGFTAGSFATRGYFWLGVPNSSQGEQIRYWGVNTTTNQFLNCERGYGNTTIQEWPAGTALTYSPLQVLYRCDVPDLVNDTDVVSISANAWHEALVSYASYRCFSKKQNMPQAAQGALANYNRIREEGRFVRERQTLDRPCRMLPYDPSEVMNGWRW